MRTKDLALQKDPGDPWGPGVRWWEITITFFLYANYASRSSMNRQFSSIFHCYTLNFRRLSMIDPTGEGFFTVKSDDVVAAFAAGDCRCVQTYRLGFLLIQFVHCLSFVNVCNHVAFVQPYLTAVCELMGTLIHCLSHMICSQNSGRPL